MASIFGFGLHYVLPQLRKQLPWLCFSHPILKSREYGQFEVRKAAKVMWFEKAFMWLQFLEKAVVFPMVVLSALSMDMDSMRNQMNYRWYSAIILVVCGLKLFRSIFSGKIVCFFLNMIRCEKLYIFFFQIVQSNLWFYY